MDVFGSFATGLYLPTSDIDLVVQWDMDAQSQPEMMQNALVSLERQLINKGIYADVKVIRTSVSTAVLSSLCHCPISVCFLFALFVFYCVFNFWVAFCTILQNLRQNLLNMGNV